MFGAHHAGSETCDKCGRVYCSDHLDDVVLLKRPDGREQIMCSYCADDESGVDLKRED
jgi:hypothetical protein